MESAHLKMKEEVSAIALVRECPVCLQPGAAGTMHSLPCGHTFCANCCVEHILSKLKAGVTSGTSINSVGTLQELSLTKYKTIICKVLANFQFPIVVANVCLVFYYSYK